ncbi:hypothetical protein IID62_12025 [candidate division KSB1 bacterium]|nr:hypothetical protein [candidate division KSB1 bacterium]MCH8285436.1 hypothetical protein [candidate division KSB1 bacterium]
MINAIILTHGDFGRALLNTTEKIIGPVDAVKVLSNELTSIKDLVIDLDKIVNDWRDNDILIAVDFCGGSCWHAAQVVKRNKNNVVLISGINLPMMLSFVSRRDAFKLPELAEYLKESSIKGTELIIQNE